VDAGKLRALGVTSRERTPALPDVPSMAEAGVTGYEVLNWFGMFAPIGTPEPIVKRRRRSGRQHAQRFCPLRQGRDRAMERGRPRRQDSAFGLG
jgi:hypothetical protein